MVDGDRNYILGTWRRSEEEAIGHLEGERFKPTQDATMAAILDRPTTVVTVAHPANEPDAIAGWCAVRGRTYPGPVVAPVVYYVFTREEARRLGLARFMLGELASRRGVLYTSQPARVRTDRGWESSPVPVPRGWRYMPRAAYVEV